MKVYNICNLIKGFDEDGLRECFQRVGGGCEPTSNFQMPITSEPGDRKIIE